MKTVVITGGTGDLGSVVVPRLATEFRCVVPYRKTPPPAMNNVVPLPSLDSIADLKPIYALVNLAGGFGAGSSPEQFEKMLDANLMSAVRALAATLPHIENGGRIVMISSASSLTRPAGLAAYNASKAALNAVVETLARDLKDRSITVNALLPTALDTPSMRKEMPPERLVKRSNVAEMVALLLSEQAAAVTGQLIGMSA